MDIRSFACTYCTMNQLNCPVIVGFLALEAYTTLEKYANATNGMLRETAKSVDRYADTILQKTNAPDAKKPDA